MPPKCNNNKKAKIPDIPWSEHNNWLMWLLLTEIEKPVVRATPKSNSVDNVRALQGDATVLEKTIKL